MKRFFFFIFFLPFWVHAQSFVSTGGPIVWSLPPYTLSLGNPTVTASTVHPGNFVVTFPVSEDLHAGWQDYSYTLHTIGGGTLPSSFQVNYPATSFVLEFGPDFNGLSNVVSTSGGVGTITVSPGSTLPQTCTISNSTGPVVNGQTITGTAFGAQAGNAYNISVVGGHASAAINSSTGAYSVTATGTGPIAVQVWISAGNGYAESNRFNITSTASSSYKMKVTIPANAGDFAVVYTLKQGSTVVGSFTQLPGAGAVIQTLDLGSNGGAVTISGAVVGAAYDGVNLIVSSGTTTPLHGFTQTLTPHATDVPLTDFITTPPVATVQAVDSANTPDQSPVIWSAPTTTAAAGDGLTNQVFREGIDKLLNAGAAGDSSGDSVDLSALPDATPNVTQMQVDSVISKLPVAPTFVAPSSVNSVAVTLPMMTGLTTKTNTSFTWDFSGWSTQLSWLRTLIFGCLSVWFFFAVNRQLRDSVAN